MLRNINSKEEFTRIIRELKRIRRNHEVVNQRCQSELTYLGFNYVEFYDISENINEHSISIVDASSYRYGTILIYGMQPTETPKYLSYSDRDKGKTKKILYRGYAMRLEIPDFYKPLKEKTEEELKKEAEERKEMFEQYEKYEKSSDRGEPLIDRTEPDIRNTEVRTENIERLESNLHQNIFSESGSRYVNKIVNTSNYRQVRIESDGSVRIESNSSNGTGKHSSSFKVESSGLVSKKEIKKYPNVSGLVSGVSNIPYIKKPDIKKLNVNSFDDTKRVLDEMRDELNRKKSEIKDSIKRVSLNEMKIETKKEKKNFTAKMKEWFNKNLR